MLSKLKKVFFSVRSRFPSRFWEERALQFEKEAIAAEETLSDLYWEMEDLKDSFTRLKTSMKYLAKSAAQNGVSHQTVYEAAGQVLDPEGDILYHEAQNIFGKFQIDGHIEEEWLGKYDGADGKMMFGYLLQDIQDLDGPDEEYVKCLNQVYTNTLVKTGLLDFSHYASFFWNQIPLYCSDMFTDEQICAIYHKWCKRVDAGGFALFREAELLLGKFDCREFAFEDDVGVFEYADGFDLLPYLLVQYAHKLGQKTDGRWSPVSGTCYEKCEDFSLDETTEEYRTFKATLYQNACHKLGLIFHRVEMEREYERRTLPKDAARKLTDPLCEGLQMYSNEQIEAALRGCWVG